MQVALGIIEAHVPYALFVVRDAGGRQGILIPDSEMLGFNRTAVRVNANRNLFRELVVPIVCDIQGYYILSRRNVDEGYEEHIDAPGTGFVQPVRYRFPRRPSPLKNSYMPLTDPYSSLENAVFGLFKLDLGLVVSPPATFSTGSLLIGSRVDRGNGSPLALLAEDTLLARRMTY